MKIIVGLGNPDRKYIKNVHNLGFMVIDEVASKLNVSIDKKGYKRVIVHAPLKEGVGLAVYNRLVRAAGFKVIDL